MGFLLSTSCSVSAFNRIMIPMVYIFYLAATWYQHLHCRFSGVLRFQMYFFKCNSKVDDLFVSWYDKRPEYVLYPSLSWIWNMSGSSKEAAFWWKNSHVTITWHAVVPCEHLYCRQVHAHHFSSRVWGTLVEEDEIWGQFLFEPRLHVVCRVIV